MSGFFGLIKHGPKAGKYVMETVVPKISKNLKDRFKTKQEGFKSVDDQTKGTNVDISKKSKIKKEFSKAVSDAYDKFEGATKKAKGGRVGLKRGTGLMPKKKSNVDKIKKTFGPKNKLGMQSVIYGLDKNPKITKADPKAKFIAAANKKKKKVIT
jgi:hypothetical protein